MFQSFLLILENDGNVDVLVDRKGTECTWTRVFKYSSLVAHSVFNKYSWSNKTGSYVSGRASKNIHSTMLRMGGGVGAVFL